MNRLVHRNLYVTLALYTVIVASYLAGLTLFRSVLYAALFLGALWVVAAAGRAFGQFTGTHRTKPHLVTSIMALVAVMVFLANPNSTVALVFGGICITATLCASWIAASEYSKILPSQRVEDLFFESLPLGIGILNFLIFRYTANYEKIIRETRIAHPEWNIWDSYPNPLRDLNNPFI